MTKKQKGISKMKGLRTAALKLRIMVDQTQVHNLKVVMNSKKIKIKKKRSHSYKVTLIKMIIKLLVLVAPIFHKKMKRKINKKRLRVNGTGKPR